jgi:hypothetical protein
MEGEGALVDERRGSLEHGEERIEQDRSLSFMVRHRPVSALDLATTLGIGAKLIEEPAFYGHLGDIEISRISLQPRASYRLTSNARVSGGARMVQRTAQGQSVSLPPDVQASDPPGFGSSWDMMAEYRVTRSVTSSLSYGGEKRPGHTGIHNLTGEVRAYF